MEGLAFDRREDSVSVVTGGQADRKESGAGRFHVLPEG